MSGTWNSSWPLQVVSPYVWGDRWRTLVTRFEDGGEQRRQKLSSKIMAFHIEFTAIGETTLNQIRTFFNQQKGMYDTFTFTNPHDSQSYTVRFANDTFQPQDHGADTFSLSVDLVEVR